MDACLYDPEHGFYASGVGMAGRRGDFLTSVEVGPLFGAVVARWLDFHWDRLGQPDPFVVADVGAGPGTFARELHAARPRCIEALDLVLIERSPSGRSLHDRTLGRSLVDLDALECAHVIFANELLDNLAVRVLQRHRGQWLEVFVGPGEGPSRQRLLPASDVPAVVTALTAPLVGNAQEDHPPSVPVARCAAEWVDAARAKLVEGGRLLAFDYGADTAELAWRAPTAWLRTFRQHQPGTSPFESPGQQDITCDVPLDQLPPPLSRMRQADWLRHWGIEAMVEEGRKIWSERAALGDLASIRARSRVREADALLDPNGLGWFWALEWDGLAEP